MRSFCDGRRIRSSLLCHPSYVQSDDLPPPSSLHKHTRISVLIANLSPVDLTSYSSATSDHGGLSINTYLHIVIGDGLQLQLTGPETPDLPRLVSAAAIGVNNCEVIRKDSLKDCRISFGIGLNQVPCHRPQGLLDLSFLAPLSAGGRAPSPRIRNA